MSNSVSIGSSLLLVFVVGLSAVVAYGCHGRTLLNGISEYEKQTILNMHNKMRQSVALGNVGNQPPAANMMEMKWDNELARIAQSWVDRCNEHHDPSRHVSRFSVGQNIATTWTTKEPEGYYDAASDFPYAIGKWFEEARLFTFGGLIGEKRTGHYTQMMWANTNLVGCGYSFYYDPSKGYTKNYVCNYGPGGNILGRTPYQKGYPSCTNFGLQDSNVYSGLCSKPSDYYFGVSNYLQSNNFQTKFNFNSRYQNSFSYK